MTTTTTRNYELEPRYSTQKSFYGKAVVIPGFNEDVIRLRSYDTIVAEIRNGEAIVKGIYSRTTLKHIKEFLLQHGFEAKNQNQIVDDYMKEEQ